MSRYQNNANDSEQWAAYQRRRDEQLGVVNRESLEQLQTAVNQAAAAGDPMAGQLRAGTGDALLRNLTLHFTNRAAELKSSVSTTPDPAVPLVRHPIQLAG